MACDRFITRTCNGCEEFEVNGKDIPSEGFMHFVYLGKFDFKVTLSKICLCNKFNLFLFVYINFSEAVFLTPLFLYWLRRLVCFSYRIHEPCGYHNNIWRCGKGIP